MVRGFENLDGNLPPKYGELQEEYFLSINITEFFFGDLLLKY
jgi:hypothetical protein